MIGAWGAAHASATVLTPAGVHASRGDRDHRYRWASVTKPVTAFAALIAADQGLIDLDEPAGPPGSSVRHLLAHASGLPFDGHAVLAQPGSRRIYSNTGIDAVADLIAERTGAPFEAALESWVLGPLGMAGTTLVERPSQGLQGPLRDLEAFAVELLEPTLISRSRLYEASHVAFPGLVGVTPGVGNFDPCDWGLGFELHGSKAPHWMGTRNSPETFGHFGGSGTFLWVDPAVALALVVLTDRSFSRWALQAWPRFSDDVLAAAGDG